MEGTAVTGRGSRVTLQEITAETVVAICELRVKRQQNRFVAPNAYSIAQAHFAPAAWFRAIYADETPVGFVMLDDDAESHEYTLWRFIIAGRHQGMGFGRRALELVVDYVKTRPGATALLTSCVPGEGSPRDFYAKFGFEETGEEHDGELVMRLPLG